MYKHILSFGCMCSTANFIKKLGLRENSSFFDWIDTNIQTNIRIIDNDFRDILERNYLIQPFSNSPHIIRNIEYGFCFVHCFDSKRSFSSQIKKVRKKVYKQIDNFKKCINDGGTLLIYYCRDSLEQKWIETNQKLLSKFAKRINCNFLFIVNEPFREQGFCFKWYKVEANNVHIPFGGKVSYPIVDNCGMGQWLISNYDSNKRNDNLRFLKKHKKKNLLKVIFKLIRKRDILKV